MPGEGSRPPRFALPDGGGKTRELRTFLGRDRIAVVFGPDEAWVRVVRAARTHFVERDLSVLIIVPPGHALAKSATEPPLFFLTDTSGAVARRYGARAATFFLIGKDGTVKMARRGSPTQRELFGLIDAMPMRRREMRERR